MFSKPQHTTSELQQYDYFVMQEPVFEEKIEEPVFTCVYEESGVLYCASSTSKGGYYYSYVLNNPLRFTDPSGYMFEPKDPKGVAVNRSGEPIYQYLYYGPGRGDPGNIGWGNTLGEVFYNLANARPPEAGAADVGGWSFNYATGNYENSETGETLSPVEFDALIVYSGYGQIGETDYYNSDGSYAYTSKVFGYTDVSVQFASNSGAYGPDEGYRFGTASEFYSENKGLSYNEVVTQLGVDRKGRPIGPNMRFVEDPLNPGKYIDMRHMLVVGKRYGSVLGAIGEVAQWFGPWFGIDSRSSAFNPQDIYSNNLGETFFINYYSIPGGDFGEKLHNYLNVVLPILRTTDSVS